MGYFEKLVSIDLVDIHHMKLNLIQMIENNKKDIERNSTLRFVIAICHEVRF